MNIRQNLVSEDKYKVKCPYEMTAECIVIHNTDNDASAENEVAYMIRNNKQVSFHFAVDDQEIWQGVPLNRNTWHCGDGSKGKGNRTGISIEICYSESGGDKFTAAEKNAAKFVAELLHERKWGIDRVGKHQDYSGKDCPKRTLALGWDRFLEMIQAELNALQNPKPETKAETFKVGDAVHFKGGKHYTSATAKTGSSATAGSAKVTHVAEGKAHPYHLVHTDKTSNVYGWVDADTVCSVAAEEEPELKVGDKVRLAGKSPQYGKSFLFASFVYKSVLYVREIRGDRVVISTVRTGAVTGAVHKKYLTKI